MWLVFETYKKDFPAHNYYGKGSMKKLLERDYKGSGKHLKAAMKKYGKDAFERKLLGVFDDEQLAYDFEEKMISENESYYNIAPGGEGLKSGKDHPQFGKPQPPEVREKISNTLKGRPKPPRSEAHRKNLSKAMMGRAPNIGNTLISAERRKEIADTRINNYCPTETILEALVRCGSQKAAAAELGIHRGTIQARLKREGINPRDYYSDGRFIEKDNV